MHHPRSIETADAFDVQLCRVDPRAGVDDGAMPFHVSLVVLSNGVPGREAPLLVGRLSGAEARALGALLLEHADLVNGEIR